MKFHPPSLVLILLTAHVAANEPTHSTADVAYFEKKVRPILAERCYSCHSADAKPVRGGLRLDTSDHLFAGGDAGPVVVGSKPNKSLLVQAVRYDSDSIQMQPDGKLPDKEIAELIAWVERGAPIPVTGTPGRRTDKIDFDAGRRFWSFQPATRQLLPQVSHAQWPRERMDHFVLAALEREGLQPSPEADRHTILRRLYFDLTGLPPSPAEVRRFVSDTRSDAYTRQVDRLLQSPQFGERWARTWLDLARYTDKTASWLQSTGDAYLYRDWVVDAMNADMSYREFVQRQLATDYLSHTGPDDLPATRFLRPQSKLLERAETSSRDHQGHRSRRVGGTSRRGVAHIPRIDRRLRTLSRS